MTLTITYGELKLDCECHVQPIDRSVGIMSPEITIEEIRLTRSYYNQDGAELDMGDIEGFIFDRFLTDQSFAMIVQELVEEAYDDIEEAA